MYFHIHIFSIVIFSETQDRNTYLFPCAVSHPELHVELAVLNEGLQVLRLVQLCSVSIHLHTVISTRHLQLLEDLIQEETPVQTQKACSNVRSLHCVLW